MTERIRPTRPEEFETVMAIYLRAREYMKETGNPTQWGDFWPDPADVREDIRLGTSFVCEIEGQIEGVFMLQSGAEPTYGYIEDGGWHSDAPYHTVHRIAASGHVPGIFRRCIHWAYENYGYLRIDTHADNAIMRHLIEKSGFLRSGIIYIPDGSSRIAYEKL